MNKIKFLLVTIILCIITIPVYADNKVDYKLTITKDYKFNEVIQYEISDYKQKQNGYNPFVTIIDNDVYVDIMQKSKYQKTKTFKNGKYYVTLKHTFNEYSLSNSIFLNDCFENTDYNYDMEEIDFYGSDGFYCLKGDELKITLITDFTVTSTNATISGNNYIWNPTDDYFTMNFKMEKTYENTSAEPSEGHGIDEGTAEENTTGIDDSNYNPAKEEQQENKMPKILPIVIISITVVGALTTLIVLKIKKSNLNKI